jgi:hypothetical protein
LGVTFYERTLNHFEDRANSRYRLLLNAYLRAGQRVHEFSQKIIQWGGHNRYRLLAIFVGVGLLGVFGIFLIDAVNGRLAENASRIALGGILSMPFLGLLLGIAAGGIFYLALGLFDLIAVRLVYILMMVLFVPVLVLSLAGVLLVVAVQVILLIPLAAFVAIRAVQVRAQHKFYTCPNPGCNIQYTGIYHGLPTYCCPNPACSKPHPNLWPSWSGVFYHVCDNCGTRLPTLDILGRDQLSRICGHCQTVIPHPQHAEMRIEVIGGSRVGKTSFLLATARQLIESRAPDAVQVALPQQQHELETHWTNLEHGVPPPPTTSVTSAYLFFLSDNHRQTTLYYYDASDQQFATIRYFDEHEILRGMHGLILLIDPFTLPALSSEATNYQDAAPSSIPFNDVVSATIAAAARVQRSRFGQKSRIPLAVVITKADMQPIRNTLGNFTQVPENERCRMALEAWQAGNDIRALEIYFETVRYFACSALGRSPSPSSPTAFIPMEVLPPLQWLLNTADKA